MSKKSSKTETAAYYTQLAQGAGEALGPVLDKIREMIDDFEQKHPKGSVVMMGDYANSHIKLFGDEACIVVDGDKGNIVYLTSDEIKSCLYIKEKRRPSGYMYYFYKIEFIDGKKSFVRMRQPYMDAMMKHLTNNEMIVP